jgi:hypothetical protein
MTKGEVGSANTFIAREQYVSKAGNSEWKVSKSCTINQQLENALLEPGKALKVQTYSQYGQELERFYIQIPCDRAFGTTVAEYPLSTVITVTEATVCDAAGSDVAVVKDVEQDKAVIERPQIVQSCSISAGVNESSREYIAVKLNCAQNDRIEVNLLNSEGSVVRSKIVDTRSNQARLLNFNGRDPNYSLSLTVAIKSYGYNYSNKKNVRIEKDPTNFAQVKMKLLTPQSVSAMEESKKFGRGFYYSSNIKAVVSDADLEADGRQAEIRVQLINTTNDRFDILSERNVTTGFTLDFTVDGQYIMPKWFGDNHWDEDYILRAGVNTFKIRVFEAYSQDKYIDSETISVSVPKH